MGAIGVELHDKTAEQSLLGSILISGTVYPLCRQIVSAADFSVPEYAAIWRVIEQIADSDGGDINLITVSAAVSRSDIHATAAEVAKLTDAVQGSTRHTPHLAAHVRSLADKRRISDICARAVAGLTSAESSHGAASELISELEQLATNSRADGFVGMLDATTRTKKLHAQPLAATSTGIQRLDDLRVQFHPGDYVILGGQTSHGKSAMALNMLLAAAKSGVPCFLFSLEMPVSAVMERVWSCLGGVPLPLVRQGPSAPLSPSQGLSLRTAQATAQALPIKINDRAGIGLDDVRACATAAPEGSLIVIDYIGLMTPARGASAYGSKVHEVSATSLGLQRIARDHNVTLLALSQLSRKSDGRVDKSPQLSDLRDSGSLEQDASVVMLVSLPHRYDAGEPDTRAVLTVAKHRQGECGSVEMHFEGQFTRYTQATLATTPASSLAAKNATRPPGINRTQPKRYNYAGARQ